MKKIVSMIQTFAWEQKVFVYEDGIKIDAMVTNLEELPLNILNLAKQYEVNNIELAGPKSYLNGIKNKIETLEMDTYSTHNIDIKIISN